MSGCLWDLFKCSNFINGLETMETSLESGCWAWRTILEIWWAGHLIGIMMTWHIVSGHDTWILSTRHHHTGSEIFLWLMVEIFSIVARGHYIMSLDHLLSLSPTKIVFNWKSFVKIKSVVARTEVICLKGTCHWVSQIFFRQKSLW